MKYSFKIYFSINTIDIMCRLFGLIANKPVDVEFSFFKADISFKELGSQNPDGWGVGYYKNEEPRIDKERINIEESEKVNKVIKQQVSNLFIAHVRKTSGTAIKYENTHPFEYNNWIFAHNGTIDIKNNIREKLLPKYTNFIKGDTDSELYFLLLMQNIEQDNKVIQAIKKTLEFIGKNRGNKTTSLNFLLSDGKKIYALRKAFTNTDSYSLLYLNRDPNKVNELDYKSEQTRMMIYSKRLYGEKAVIICSEQLSSDEEWIPLSNGDLLIADKNLNININKIL